MSHGLFPKKEFGFVQHFILDRNQKMSVELQKDELALLPLKERVRFGLKTRIGYLIPFIKTWPQVIFDIFYLNLIFFFFFNYLTN